MNEMLCEVLSLCYKISKDSEADVFLDYMPHCDAYCVKVYSRGWKSGGEMYYLTDHVEHINEENLKNTIIQLKAIALFLGVEL